MPMWRTQPSRRRACASSFRHKREVREAAAWSVLVTHDSGSINLAVGSPETVFPVARTDKKRRDNDHDDLEAVGYAA